MTTIARLSLVLSLLAASLFAGDVTVKGRIVDRDKKPVEGALVSTPGTNPAPLRALAAKPSNVKSDAAGEFKLTLSTGSYDFVFQKEGFVARRLRATSPASTPAAARSRSSRERRSSTTFAKVIGPSTSSATTAT